MHSIVLVIAAILLAASAQAQPLELKFSHFLGPASFFQHDVAEPFAKELEAKSGGRAKVAIYNASSPLGKPTEQATQASKRVVNLSDLKGLRLRSPNRTVSAALEHVGAVPAVLQVNEVMDAVKAGKIEGIVTNWGNPLQGFNDHMKFHTDTQFYTSAFFIVMNRGRYESLPGDVKQALDSICCEAWVAKFGPLWDKWDAPVREGARAPGHEVIVPDPATMAQWREGLRPVSERYLDELSGKGFRNARAAYVKMLKLLGR
jgi:TRAP-type C4-dicarboxylate transport system substrate-binding protein